MSKLVRETKVVLTNVRLSYANLFTPKAIQEGAQEKYSVSLIIDKNDTETIDLVKKAIENAKAEGKVAKWGGKLPGNLKQPLRDGDTDREGDDAYANSYFINANSTQAPEVVGKFRDPETGKPLPLGEDEVYSGCYANVSVNFFAYDARGNKGIGAGLGNVQKVKDGDRLGGKTSASSDFDFEEADDMDFLG